MQQNSLTPHNFPPSRKEHFRNSSIRSSPRQIFASKASRSKSPRGNYVNCPENCNHPVISRHDISIGRAEGASPNDRLSWGQANGTGLRRDDLYPAPHLREAF
ncbi:hypothetical protein Trydic_g13767 [Trypoxylus dichotomus]